MITKEEYKEIVDTNYPYLMRIWGDDITELIEALRTVARAAKVVNGHFAHEEGTDLYKMDTALAALPAWVLEEEA